MAKGRLVTGSPQPAGRPMSWGGAHRRARVMATFMRRGSVTKPRRPRSLQRTVENTIASASRPW